MPIDTCIRFESENRRKENAHSLNYVLCYLSRMLFWVDWTGLGTTVPHKVLRAGESLRYPSVM